MCIGRCCPHPRSLSQAWEKDFEILHPVSQNWEKEFGDVGDLQKWNAPNTILR